MKTENPKSNPLVKDYKKSLRLFLKEKRAKLKKSARKMARDDAHAELKKVLKLFPYVLSFASTEDEIDLWPINNELASEGRLLLPRIEGEDILCYQVNSCKTDLISSKWGFLEPDPKKCLKISPDEISCVLVPALGFDTTRHRLGYGKGFYDRLIKNLPTIPAFGVGFKEQMVQDRLPIDPHDRRLTRLYLF
ncbi:MAG: 5-formyltetrahydrofolate cyclo-ligase [Simkaniaceae bacterium]